MRCHKEDKMKKILFIISMAIVSIYAKPCMTDIYFGNGVWNDREQAKKSKDELRKFMFKANTLLDPLQEGTTYRFGYIHNPSHGIIDDLIETHWQLYQSEQITYPYFYTMSAMLSEVTGNITADEIREIINNVVTDYNNDVVAMKNIYQNASFNQRHNVLLVAHSQGNLFGNKMYTLLNDQEKAKFRMVSVATPAGYVKTPGQTSPYVTLIDDWVIAPIPGSLRGYVEGFGHSFVPAYLSNSTASEKIALYVKNAYNNLQQTTSCTLYDGTYVRVYGFSHMEVYAYTTGIPRITDLIATVPISTFDPQYDENNMPYCPSPMTHYPGSTYFGACDASSCSWLPGNLDSTALEHRKGLTHHALKDNQCATFSLSEELYDTIYHALNE